MDFVGHPYFDVGPRYISGTAWAWGGLPRALALKIAFAMSLPGEGLMYSSPNWFKYLPCGPENSDEQDYCSARLRELENKQRLHFMSYTT